MDESARVVGMGSFRKSNCTLRRAGGEDFAAGDTNAFASVRFVYLGCVGTKPSEIPIERLAPSPGIFDQARVIHLFDRDQVPFSSTGCSSRWSTDDT